MQTGLQAGRKIPYEPLRGGSRRAAPASTSGAVVNVADGFQLAQKNGSGGTQRELQASYSPSTATTTQHSSCGAAPWRLHRRKSSFDPLADPARQQHSLLVSIPDCGRKRARGQVSTGEKSNNTGLHAFSGGTSVPYPGDAALRWWKSLPRWHQRRGTPFTAWPFRCGWRVWRCPGGRADLNDPGGGVSVQLDARDRAFKTGAQLRHARLSRAVVIAQICWC